MGTIFKYVHKFIVHARYTPKYVATKDEKIWRFLNKLVTRIGVNLVVAGGMKLEVAEKAKCQEWQNTDTKKIHKKKGIGRVARPTIE